MSLKAGRVGVNPADVDPISGHISSEASEGYTKAQADDKFLSKSDAVSTYETKSDAADLQPKTLSVPISMLVGSQLVPKSTVEDVMATMNNGMTTEELTERVTVRESAVTNLISGATASSNILRKIGNIVYLDLVLSAVTCSSGNDLGFIPNEYRPAAGFWVSGINRTDYADTPCAIVSAGAIKSMKALSSKEISIHTSWMIS